MQTSQEMSKRLIIFALIVTFVVVSVLVVYRSLSLPVLIAAVLAYIFFPLQKFLEKRGRMDMLSATMVVLLLLTLVVIGAVAGIVPIVKMEIQAITAMIPRAKLMIMEKALPWLRETLLYYGVAFDEFDWQDLNVSSHIGGASQAVGHLFNRTSLILGGVITAALVPVFLFFFLFEAERIKRFLMSLVPLDLRSAVRNFTIEVDATMRAVLKRQMMVAIILAVLYSIGFSVVGLRFSLAVGLIAGVCRLVPYLDVIVGVVLSALVILTDPADYSWSTALGVGVVITFVQILDGMVITPRIVGDRVGLHPAIVIATVLAFADWFGFVGILVAIPVAAVVKILLVASVRAYRESSFFTASK